MITKPFNCVEMVEQAQEAVQAHLETLSREEQLEFWRVETEKLRQLQQQNLQEEKQDTSANRAPAIKA